MNFQHLTQNAASIISYPLYLPVYTLLVLAPICAVVCISFHAFWRLVHNRARPLQRYFEQRVTSSVLSCFPSAVATMSYELLAIHKAFFIYDQSVCSFDAALDAGNEVV